MPLKQNCQRCFGGTFKTVLTALLTLQLLALLALTACPLLHHALHPDSDQPGHDCLVIAFAKGQVSEALMPEALAFFAVFAACGVLMARIVPQPIFACHFAPGRAPPRR